ncbi:ATP-binding cassette sub-family A member 17-like [Haemaphysalis longicornis]
MTASSHATVVFWRVLIVQRLKRHYLEALVEVAVVLMFAFAYFPGNMGGRPANPEASQWQQPVVSRQRDEGQIRAAYFRPNTSRAAKLVREAYPGNRLQGFDDLHDLIITCAVTANEVCVSFTDFSEGPGPGGVGRRLEYTLHYSRTQADGGDYEVGFYAPDDVYPDVSVVQPLFLQAFWDAVYINSAYIRLEAGANLSEDEISVKPFPSPSFPQNVSFYRTGVIWFFVFVFLYPAGMLISRIVTESTTGIKEQERLMGLEDMSYWVGNLAAQMVFFMSESLVIMYVAVAQMGFTGTAFLEDTDPSLVLVTLFTFAWLQVLQAMLIACVANSVNRGLLAAVVLLVLLPLWVAGVARPTGSLVEFVFQARATLLLSALVPSVSAYHVFTLLAIQNDFDDGAHWSKLHDLALGVGHVRIWEFWLISWTEVFVLGFFIFYLPKVLPWATPVTLQPLFFLSPSYWFPVPTEAKRAETGEETDPRRFERSEEDSTPLIAIRNLNQNYGGYQVLKNINLTIYENKCTALVGRNGAGKTTLLNIIAGLVKPTSGTVHVCGFDVSKDTVAARSFMSYCPERNILFPDLTVWEHLIYFGALKGLDPRGLKVSAENALRMVHLERHVSDLVDDLDAGCKKQLSIAVAAMGRPKLLLLDEPTSSLDTTACYGVLDLIRRARKTSTLVISTHNMGEADILADRIVGLANGSLLCDASPAHLKRMFHVGYRVKITKQPTVDFKLNNVMGAVSEAAPAASIDEDTADDVLIALHTVKCDGFASMFGVLERNAHAWGIGSIGVTVATMKDVYLMLNLGSPAPSALSPEATKTLSNSVHKLIASKGGRPSLGAIIFAIFTKRLKCLYRSPYVPCVLFFVSPLLLAITFYAASAPLSQEDVVLDITVPVSLARHYPKGPTFIQEDKGASSKLTRTYRALLKEQGVRPANISRSAEEWLLKLADQDFEAYTQGYVLGASFKSNRSEAWFNPYASLSRSLTFDLLSNTLLRVHTNDSAARMRTVVALHSQFNDINQGKETSKDDGDEGNVATVDTSGFLDSGPLPSAYSAASSMLATWSLGCPLAVAMLVTGFVHFPASEQLSGMTELQLMTGFSGSLYCTLNLMFDAILYVVAFFSAGVVFAIFYKVSAISWAALAVLALSFGGTGILSAHIIGYIENRQSPAVIGTIFVYCVGGCLVLTLDRILENAKFHTLHMAMAIVASGFPPTALIVGVAKVVALEWVRTACEEMATRGGTGYFCHQLLSAEDKTPGSVFPGHAGFAVRHCCSAAEQNTSADSHWSPFNLGRSGIGIEALALSLQACLLFVWMSSLLGGGWWLHERLRLGLREPKVDEDEEPVDADVRREARLVQRICYEGNYEEYAMVVEDACGWVDNTYLVRDLSLAIRRGECFCLLGVIGSGKTTVVKMLAALTPMNRGQAYTDLVTLSEDPRTWQSMLGYAPYEYPFLDCLTGLEILYLFARLRGVRSERLHRAVGSVIDIVDLGVDANKMCSDYSSGARRKLSIAVALVGLPNIMLLDEATEGVDIVSREMIHEALGAIRKKSKRTFIITSHCADECERVSSRVGVLVKGRLLCLGDMRHLQKKFGKGRTLTIRVAETKTRYLYHKIDAFVRAAEPEAQLEDYREGVFSYLIAEARPWSELFQLARSLHDAFRLEYVLVCDSSLDAILLGVARTEMAEHVALLRREARHAAKKPVPGSDPWGREFRVGRKRRKSSDTGAKEEKPKRKKWREDDVADDWPRGSGEEDVTQ